MQGSISESIRKAFLGHVNNNHIQHWQIYVSDRRVYIYIYILYVYIYMKVDKYMYNGIVGQALCKSKVTTFS